MKKIKFLEKMGSNGAISHRKVEHFIFGWLSTESFRRQLLFGTRVSGIGNLPVREKSSAAKR